jgi:hypothetical protein
VVRAVVLTGAGNISCYNIGVNIGLMKDCGVCKEDSGEFKFEWVRMWKYVEADGYGYDYYQYVGEYSSTARRIHDGPARVCPAPRNIKAGKHPVR